MADAAKILAQTEVTSEKEADEARLALSAGLAEIERLNDQVTTDQELDNNEVVAESAYLNGEATAKSWKSAYESAAGNSYEFAKAAIHNMKVATTGEGTPIRGNFAVNYQGATHVSQEAVLVEETQKVLENAESQTQ